MKLVQAMCYFFSIHPFFVSREDYSIILEDRKWYQPNALIICTWFLKNQVRQTWFLVYFELDFYCLCSLQKSSSSNLISQTGFYKNQVQMDRAWAMCNTGHLSSNHSLFVACARMIWSISYQWIQMPSVFLIKEITTSAFKVHIFWEGQKILRNLSLTFDYSTYSQK